MPTYAVNIVPSFTEIRPSTEISCHGKEVLTDGRTEGRPKNTSLSWPIAGCGG